MFPVWWFKWLKWLSSSLLLIASGYIIIHWQFLRAASRSAGYSWGFWVVIAYSGCFPMAQWWRIRLQCKRHQRPGFDPWVKMATLSSILAWGIPWTEEPGRLQSIGSQRAGHNWATEHSACCDQYMKPNEQMHIKIVKHAGASLVSLMITSSWGCFLLVLSVFMIPSYCPLVLLQRLSVLFFSFLCGEFPLSPKAEFEKLVQHCNRWIGNSCKATSDCCFGIGTTACPSHVYA